MREQLDERRTGSADPARLLILISSRRPLHVSAALAASGEPPAEPVEGTGPRRLPAQHAADTGTALTAAPVAPTLGIGTPLGRRALGHGALAAEGQ